MRFYNKSNSVDSKFEITLPNVEGMYPHQLEVLEDKHRFKVLVWHRRARKTTTALEKLVLETHNPNFPKKVYWYICPTFNQAKEVVWKDPSMLQRIIPEQLIEKKNESELTIYFKSGSVLVIKGADDPVKLKGAGVFGAVLDEFGEMKPETWTEAIQPMLRANMGWVWFIGTPRGKNHLFDLYNKGQQESKEWKSWLLKASKSGVLSTEQLLAAKKDMPEPLFNQEFECSFLDNSATIFRKVKEAATAVPQEPILGHYYVAGIDLARTSDYTVIAVYDATTNVQVYQDRFNKIDWMFQKKRIAAILQHYNNAIGVIDSTGVGDAIANDLGRAVIQVAVGDERVRDIEREGVNIMPFRFTESTKKDIVEKLSIWLEQGKVKILNIPETIDELESYAYEITPLGKIRYNAPSGKFDDIVCAHALAVSQLHNAMWEAELPIKKKSLVRRNYEKLLYQQSEEFQDDMAWSEWS